MFLLAHVCAEFRDRNGNTIFRVTREQLNSFLYAPDAIQEDPLFALLVADGSVVFPPKDEKERARLENEPMRGIDAAGKKIVREVLAEEPVEDAIRAEQKGKASAKAEAKAEAKPVKAETKAEAKPTGKPAEAEKK